MDFWSYDVPVVKKHKTKQNKTKQTLYLKVNTNCPVQERKVFGNDDSFHTKPRTSILSVPVSKENSTAPWPLRVLTLTLKFIIHFLPLLAAAVIIWLGGAPGPHTQTVFIYDSIVLWRRAKGEHTCKMGGAREVRKNHRIPLIMLPTHRTRKWQLKPWLQADCIMDKHSAIKIQWPEKDTYFLKKEAYLFTSLTFKNSVSSTQSTVCDWFSV